MMPDVCVPHIKRLVRISNFELRACFVIGHSSCVMVVMSAPAYIIGIDLGTTNCAVAFADPAQGADAPVHDFAVPQLQRPGEVAALPLLPSCLYAAGDHELPAGSTPLPWGESPRFIAGAFARWQGARVPGRLVVSAKSWLCHAGVDRSAPILPWGAPAGVAKISPVDASARLLAHLAAAWNHAHPDAPIAQQEVVITVPASFDEVARALTVTAAQRAGLEKFSLVEEPQAAFYDFTARHRHDLAAALRGTCGWCWWWTWAAARRISPSFRRRRRPRGRPCGASRSASI